MSMFRVRRIIQTIFFLAATFAFVMLATGVVARAAHSRCPFSSVCFGALSLNPSVEGGFFEVGRLAGVVVTVPLIGLVITVLTLFLGRLFCGYVCPFGTLQEWLFATVNRGPRRFAKRLPWRLHRWLKWLKYLVLAATAVLAYFGLQRLYFGFCPVLAAAYPAALGVAGAITLGVIIVKGISIERFWCRYLCPYGAFLAVFMHLGNLLRLPRLRIRRNIKTSLECFRCLNYCPMYIDIGYNETITDAECIQCRHCVRRCTKSPEGKKNCLYAD